MYIAAPLLFSGDPLTKRLSQEEKTNRLIERLKLDNEQLRALNKKLSRNRGMAFEQVVDQFKEVLSGDGFKNFTVRPVYLPKHKPLSKSVFDADHSEIATLLLSDLHFGEDIRPEESNGINKYNSIIGANRLWHVISKFKRIVRGHQSMYRVEKIWVPILGDLISGSHIPELALTNDLLDAPSAVLAARLLIIAIIELKTLGLPIEIDCIVGNHGRMLLKMPAKRQAEQSFDWMVYCMLEQEFANDSQVKVRIHTGQFGVVEQFGHRIVIEHGIAVASGKERELESAIRDIFDSPIYRKATKMEGTSVDYVIIGNMHQAKDGERYMVNGCLPGSNEYGLSLRLDPIGAIQQMFGISRKRIPSWHYPLDVSDVLDGDDENSMVEFAKQFMAVHGRGRL